MLYWNENVLGSKSAHAEVAMAVGCGVCDCEWVREYTTIKCVCAHACMRVCVWERETVCWVGEKGREGGGDHVAVGYRFWYTGTHTNLPRPVNILMIFVCLFVFNNYESWWWWLFLDHVVWLIDSMPQFACRFKSLNFPQERIQVWDKGWNLVYSYM